MGLVRIGDLNPILAGAVDSPVWSQCAAFKVFSEGQLSGSCADRNPKQAADNHRHGSHFQIS